MLIDTDVNSRFHSCTLNWIPVILLPSAKQTTTKYEQVLYWRHTCIILFSCFLQKVLENPWFTCYLPKINKLYYQRDGAGRGCGNNRFGNMDYWGVHVLEGARVEQWEHSPPTNVARVQIPTSMPLCGLSLLLVLSLALRGFSPGIPVFPFPQKPTLSNSNSIWNARTRLNEFIWTLKCFVGKIAIYNLQLFALYISGY